MNGNIYPKAFVAGFGAAAQTCQNAVDDDGIVAAVPGSGDLALGVTGGEIARALVRFRSYEEISPHAKSGVCELCNQTMTATMIPK